jgi:hypothetical protein
MPQNLFIALSTGQNIANVLPILERAQPHDRIVWLESPLATKSHWSQAAMTVLHQHGFKHQEQKTLAGEEVSLFAATIRQLLSDYSNNTPIFVANGGTKLQALAAYIRPDLPVLYSLDRPCAYEWYPHGILQTGTRHAYQQHTLDLDDILQLRGMERKNTDATRIWSKQSNKPEPTWYGQNISDTIILHDEHHTFGLQRVPSNPLPGNVLWDAVQQHQQTALAALRNQLKNWAGRYPSDGFLQNIALSSRKMFDNATYAMQQQSPSPQHSLGSLFEQAVAQRTCQWLSNNPQLAAFVQSVWLNTQIGKVGKEQPIVIETDILLILKNGVLVHLECKSHKADNKDLDARLLNLQNVSSLQARMTICSPCYTDYTDKAWFRNQHEFKTRVESLNAFTWLAFDLADQPEQYTLPNDKEQISYRCGRFDVGLEKLLKPFVA